MKQFVIKKLTLSNFKGQSRVFIPNPTSTSVFARNETGKTKLYEAFAWLLTGYTDAINGKNYNLYDVTKELSADTPKAIVTAEVEIDGIEYKIERSAQAKFIRKRGSLEVVKDSSDTYETRLDDIVMSATEFNLWLDKNVGDTNLLPYMLIGERFANLSLDDRKKAREVLESISGEVSIEDMQGDYSEILADLKKYSVEQIKERCKNQLKPLKLRNDELTTLIDAKSLEFAKYDASKSKAIDEEIEKTNEALDAVNDMLADAGKALEPILEERCKIQEHIDALTNELSICRHKHNEHNRETLDKAAQPIRDIEKQNALIVAENKRIARDRAYNEQQLFAEQTTLELLIGQRESLRQQRDKIMERTFTDTTCPTCHRELPEEAINEAKKRFSDAKTHDLQIIVEQGKDMSAKIGKMEARIAELKALTDAPYEETPLLTKDELENEYARIESSLISFEDTEEYKKFNAKIAELRANMPSIALDNAHFKEQQTELQNTLKNLYVERGEYNLLARVGDEIKELKAEQSNVNIEIVVTEGKLDAIKRFEEEKANIVSDRINNRLTNCSIVMYSLQKDGELKPDCVILDNKGVPYATTNNANRLNSALELQRLFCTHCDISLPVFIDEASIYDSAHLPKFEAQCVYLYASDDVDLRIV